MSYETWALTPSSLINCGAAVIKLASKSKVFEPSCSDFPAHLLLYTIVAHNLMRLIVLLLMSVEVKTTSGYALYGSSGTNFLWLLLSDRTPRAVATGCLRGLGAWLTQCLNGVKCGFCLGGFGVFWSCWVFKAEI